MSNVKDCPFCGSKEVKVKESVEFAYSGDAYCIQCQECQAIGRTARTVEEAITAWNLRPNA